MKRGIELRSPEAVLCEERLRETEQVELYRLINSAIEQGARSYEQLRESLVLGLNL